MINDDQLQRKDLLVGVMLFAGRSTMGMSRSDAIAVHGMGQKMFENVDAIRESTDFHEMSVVICAMSEEKLDKTDEAYEAKFALQLRIRTFKQNHNI